MTTPTDEERVIKRILYEKYRRSPNGIRGIFKSKLKTRYAHRLDEMIQRTELKLELLKEIRQERS